MYDVYRKWVDCQQEHQTFVDMIQTWIIPNSSSSKKTAKGSYIRLDGLGPPGWWILGGSGPLVPQEVDISSCSWVAENPWGPGWNGDESSPPYVSRFFIITQLNMDLTVSNTTKHGSTISTCCVFSIQQVWASERRTENKHLGSKEGIAGQDDFRNIVMFLFFEDVFASTKLWVLHPCSLESLRKQKRQRETGERCMKMICFPTWRMAQNPWMPCMCKSTLPPNKVPRREN